MTGNTTHTEVYNFSQHITPLPIEQLQSHNDRQFVIYGLDNLYPNFLLELYNGSPVHKGVINSKKDYVIGDGLYFKSGTKVDFKPNPTDTFEQLIGKIVNDYLIFNYWTVEVVYNKLGKAIQWNHIPAHKVRANRDKSKFWYSNDWFFEYNNLITYDVWKAGKNEDYKNKLFFNAAYTPSVNNVYAVPEYNAAIKSIETDIEIRKFNINNIKNSFSVSTIITYFGGTPTPEIKSTMDRKIKDAYSGSNGQKMIVGFQNEGSTAPDVKNLTSPDFYKQYEQLKKDTLDDIMFAHSVVSPALFGMKTEGQLGNTTELEQAYEIFKNLYVVGRRNELETALNKLFADAGMETMEFKDNGSLFASTLSDQLKEKVYTINEIRKEAGLPEIENGNRLVDEVKPVPTAEPTITGQIPDVTPTGSPVAPIAIKPANVSSTNNKFSDVVYHHLNDADFDKVKHLGKGKSEFTTLKKLSYSIQNFSDVKAIELAFDDNKDIADYILTHGIRNQTASQIKAIIRKELGITVTAEEIRTIVKDLKDSGVVNHETTDGKITVKPNENSLENIKRVEVRYEYSGPMDDKNRPFCAKLMKLDNYYTREDIELMSAAFGYSIFDYRGGFYHNPNSNVTTPYCRHNWDAVSVILNKEGEVDSE
ncbi:phage portal protein [Mucilaginibacter gracilis]|uniref:Phage portal protein n=1 Tax=Mucilaginibacter gracilis TaxID=423350 RepID=A0A495J122_9SPHI|nr:phage portal protein [Mucilaginibacter gracilis]RKR82660.1 phage portal protein [Mucilaginibacter gracilis]